jgi:hypothetical protein
MLIPQAILSINLTESDYVAIQIFDALADLVAVAQVGAHGGPRSGKVRQYIRPMIKGLVHIRTKVSKTNIYVRAFEIQTYRIRYPSTRRGQRPRMVIHWWYLDLGLSSWHSIGRSTDNEFWHLARNVESRLRHVSYLCDPSCEGKATGRTIGSVIAVGKRTCLRQNFAMQQ